MSIRKGMAVALCMALVGSSAAIAGDKGPSGYTVEYNGGSLGSIKTGAKLKLQIAQDKIAIFDGNTMVITLPPSAVTEISYGQDVHRRVGAAIGIGVVTFGLGALMALTKSKKHFVGLTWKMPDGKGGDLNGGFAMQCDKNEYRGILTGLEGVTGKKSINSEQMTVKN